MVSADDPGSGIQGPVRGREHPLPDPFAVGVREFAGQGMGQPHAPESFSHIVVRQGKGDKDRLTPFPEALKAELKKHLERVKLLHENDPPPLKFQILDSQNKGIQRLIVGARRHGAGRGQMRKKRGDLRSSHRAWMTPPPLRALRVFA
jgi:hypothetical protein